MAGDLTGCAALKKSKSKGNDKDSANKRENGDASSKPNTVMQTTRGGLRVYKIVILGDGGVGKSAVTLQFVSHSFLDYHDPTIEDSYQQQAVIDGEAALLDILDTAGQVEFTAMRDQYMRCGEGFIICYSVTDRHSFQEASEYRKLITRVRLSEDIPLVLIANKLDLEMHRKVSTEEGRNLASQFGCPFYETSAALRHYIDDAFYSLVREIRRKEQQKMLNCLVGCLELYTSSSLNDQDPLFYAIENNYTLVDCLLQNIYCNDGRNFFRKQRSALGNGSSSEKINPRRRSRWWRIRSIFALVFRRRRNLN